MGTPPRRSRLLPVFALALAGCAAPAAEPLPHQPTCTVEHLGRSLRSLRDAFNADRDHARLVVLLSPSCPRSQFALSTLQAAVMEDCSEESFRVYLVWTELLPTDSYAAAVRASGTLDDARLRVFYDGRRAAGRTFARGLLPVSTARDVYLFYPSGANWRDELPAPRYWSHQLGRVEEKHFYSNDELYVQLHRSMRSLLEK
ncbi:MAG: hypothetical protein GY711_32615 [bacterium]|nr:hypothetical protein [bacterium]